MAASPSARIDKSPEAVERARATQIPLAEGVLDRLGIARSGGGCGRRSRFHDDLASAVAGAELVIENVPEKLRGQGARSIAPSTRSLPADTIVASDTSGIPITKLQAFMSNPARVVGMHWSNPPHIIPMIEVIAGEKTAPATVDFIVRTIRELNLLPVVVKKDVPGFVENRVLYALLREAVTLVENGVIDPEDLDTCVSWGIGYKLGIVGPMALLDMAGLDIYESVASFLNAELFDPRRRGALRARAHGRRPARHQDREGRATATRRSASAALQAERAARFVAVRQALEGRA